MLRHFAVGDNIPLVTDPLFSYQWALRSKSAGINIEKAWAMNRGLGTVVAVIDTGFRPHPDLTFKFVPGYDFISNKAYSNDGSGRDLDAGDAGDYYDYIDEDYSWPVSSPSSWHGTHVAGIIAASTNNGEGMSGVSWGARIQPIRVLGAYGGTIDDILDGMRWAAGLSVPGVPNNPTQVKIINMSLGGEGQCTEVMQKAVNEVLAAGVNIVVSAGNEADLASRYVPGNCKGVLTVAAGGAHADIASYSNFGPAVKIMAPGGDGTVKDVNGQVLSTLDAGMTDPSGPAYAGYVGTSMAAPHVAGVIALMLSRNPYITPSQVTAIIQAGARTFAVGSVCASYADACGAGMLDAQAVLLRVGNGRPLSDLVTSDEFVRVVEFYDAGSDRYQYASDPVEIKHYDNPVSSNPWKRTGMIFNAYGLGSNLAANWVAEPVCRTTTLGSKGWLQEFSLAQDRCNPANLADWQFQGYQFQLRAAVHHQCPFGMAGLFMMEKRDENKNLTSIRFFDSSLNYFVEEAKNNGWIGAGVPFCTP
jgi:hypothetical protein